MSSERNVQAEQALQTNKALAQGYYNIALPALRTRRDAINAQIGVGEPQYLRDAYAGQRAGLTEGLAAQGGAQQAGFSRNFKAALTGGNQYQLFSPADIGAQLANALYGSKFQEGQANLNQQFNLMSMGLGGAGTAGNAALGASQQQLQAIGYLPNYNPTYANVMGGLAGGASVWGAIRNYNARPGQGFVGWGTGLGPTVGTEGGGYGVTGTIGSGWG